MAGGSGISVRWISPIITASVIVMSILITLLIHSFSYIDFYEFGFLRRRSTGRVNLDRIYESGRYFLGPDLTFKIFKASGHHVNLNNTPVFTTDNLQVHLKISYQYFLIKEDLPLLHAAYDIKYEPIITLNAKEAIISTCSRFDTDEFINNRNKIWREIYFGVKSHLGGSCCIPKCKNNCPKCPIHEQCISDCKPREKGCNKEEKGLFVELRYLQLHDIDVPDRVMERRLLSLVRDLEKEKEESLNQEALIKKQTDILVYQFRNNATQTIAFSEAQSKLKRDQAKADAHKSTELARINGLASMCSRLGFTQAKDINSLEYLQTLKDSKDNITYSIDFSHAILQNSKLT
ncbi:unnamed protein product [Rotaria sordida]|uniref:Band 7 domain-containing protein n=2 Tax=Rotaria sordida TaxID=392033 RepID=A0A819DU01_9BILA|nr:unnamed protein product [Rotaria sordida]CAF1146304.1 unnamed protein product [Rotaria sordida]CAF1187605.1 unnamed protein product [Rotaria sordida]CAF1452288.1 unnamed protein product [Rotaria sordida]CAF3716561.1 unnamed protein product [Rotaria sordida]